MWPGVITTEGCVADLRRMSEGEQDKSLERKGDDTYDPSLEQTILKSQYSHCLIEEHLSKAVINRTCLLFHSSNWRCLLALLLSPSERHPHGIQLENHKTAYEREGKTRRNNKDI